MEFVWIQPGTFRMGSPPLEPGHDENEGPCSQVTISKGFYLGKYEITQAQWTAVMGTSPWSGKNFVQENPDHPAVYISWDDVQAYIQKLNTAAGESRYRLPTEAEWEYACRAGTMTCWSFGDREHQLKDHAWFAPNAWNAEEPYAHTVGTKKPNPWGLFDMHGNVWEWVQDWYGGYPRKRFRGWQDPTGPSTGFSRVLRGGSYYCGARKLRSAFREHYAPGDRSLDLGARLVRIK